MKPLILDDDLMDFGEITAETKDGAAHGLWLGAEHILQVSNTHVPIEESTLEGSGTTSLDAQGLQAAVAYDTPYAARQHEELDYEHDSGRTAKYLENAFNSEADQVRELVAREIKKSLGM